MIEVATSRNTSPAAPDALVFTESGGLPLPRTQFKARIGQTRARGAEIVGLRCSTTSGGVAPRGLRRPAPPSAS